MPMLLLVLVALTFALVTPALAIDCRGMTPLPPDVRLTAPGADVPAALAQFAGAWSGAWKDRQGNDSQCTTLVVEEVLSNGYARVIYSVGSAPAIGSGVPNFWRASGRIVNGALSFRLPEIGRPVLTWRFDGGTLAGQFDHQGSVTVTRVPDVAPLDCRRPPAAVAPPSSARDRLTAAELLAAPAPATGPIHNDYFVPVGRAEPAKHALKGTLAVPAFPIAYTRLGCAGRPRAMPGFTVSFFTHGEHLVPVTRDIVPGAAVILSPGRVWSEAGDGGLSRASFPFVVVNDIHNGTHNGLATFVFDDTRVSSVAVQIVQETAPFAKLDYAARLPVTYTPGAVANEVALRAEFDAERSRQTPIRPWSALPASAALASFDGDTREEDISANGLVMDGVLYVRGCHTRYGPFPYCREMRHGVFSVTKSLGGAVALLRLAQKYGDGVLDEKLTDYLPAGMAHAGWDGVTFADALSMATGIGDEKPTRQPNDPLADENRPKMTSFLFKRTAKEKLESALSYGKYPWNRGEVLRYNSTQTFVLAVAMDAYLKRREGPNAHLWDMVRSEVFRPVGVFHAPKMHTLEPDGSRGVPLLGYGLYPTVDDVAKLATLLQNGGRHDGVQLLHATKLADALFRSSATVGLPHNQRNRFGEGRYHLSFWSVPYRTGTGCSFQIPYMAGFGGNLVALLPSGISTFRFADAYNFDLDSMILAGESLRPFCTPPATAAAPDPPRVPLAAAELGSSFVGHAYTIGLQRIDFASGGRLYGSTPDDVDVGTWEITPDARVCRTWNVWDGRRQRCYVVYRKDDTWEIDIPGRLTRFVLRRAPAASGP